MTHAPDPADGDPAPDDPAPGDPADGDPAPGNPAPGNPADGPTDGLAPPDPAAGDAYALFVRGTKLLEQGLYLQAALSLEQARRLEPGKTSILETLGRAYFHAHRYQQAADAFSEVVERRPDDDFSQFCLGRSLEKLGDLNGARRHMSLAVGMRPSRTDYRRYLDRIRERD